LTAGRGVPWLLLVAACTAVALTLDPDSLPVSFHPGPAFQCLAGLVGSSAIAAFAPCAFLAFKGNRSLDVAAASRPIGRLERAAGAAAGSLAAAAAIAAAFAAPLVVTSNFDGQVRARTATCAVHPDVMRRPGDSVSLENPVGGEFQLFPEVGLTRGYGAGEPASSS
jgi:hypothetical protein